MEKTAGTKDRLLEAAAKIFSERGYEKAKVSDIVALADVAQGTFYLYFKSKEECLNTMSLELINSFLKELKKEEEIIDAHSMYRVVDMVLSMMQRHKDMLWITHFEQVRLYEVTFALHEKVHHEAMKIMRKSLEAAGNEGRIVDIKLRMIDSALMHYLLDNILNRKSFGSTSAETTREQIRVILGEVHI